MPKLARTLVKTPARKVELACFAPPAQLMVRSTPHQMRTMIWITVVVLGWLSFFRVLGLGFVVAMTLIFLLSFTPPLVTKRYRLATIPQPLVSPSGVHRAVSICLLYLRWFPLVEV